MKHEIKKYINIIIDAIEFIDENTDSDESGITLSDELQEVKKYLTEQLNKKIKIQ